MPNLDTASHSDKWFFFEPCILAAASSGWFPYTVDGGLL